MGKMGLCSFKQNHITGGKDEEEAGKEVGACTAMRLSSVVK